MTQTIRDVDKEIWRKFAAYCKLNNVKVGSKLNKVLEEYLEKHFRIK